MLGVKGSKIELFWAGFNKFNAQYNFFLKLVMHLNETTL